MAIMWTELFDRNPYGTNCWLLAADGSDEAVIVDPGFEPDAVRSRLAALGRQPAAIVLTHAHVDHASAAGELAGDGVPVFVHAADALAFTDPAAWGAGFANVLSEASDLRLLQDRQVLRLAGLAVAVMHTPGHTPGHCIFRTDADESVLLSGDLVFAGSVGRSDLLNSSREDMGRSLARFLELPDDLRVLPGHGPPTEVGRERTGNPFLQRASRAPVHAEMPSPSGTSREYSVRIFS
jgi:hydroxyacylglutathione hydrolase